MAMIPSTTYKNRDDQSVPRERKSPSQTLDCPVTSGKDKIENGWVDGWIDGWMGGWMDGWVDRWMDRWMDGWMDGQIDELSSIL